MASQCEASTITWPESDSRGRCHVRQLETPATAGHDAEADPFSVPETPDQESGMVGVATKSSGAKRRKGKKPISELPGQCIE